MWPRLAHGKHQAMKQSGVQAQARSKMEKCQPRSPGNGSSSWDKSENAKTQQWRSLTPMVRRHPHTKSMSNLAKVLVVDNVHDNVRLRNTQKR